MAIIKMFRIFREISKGVGWKKKFVVNFYAKKGDEFN